MFRRIKKPASAGFFCGALKFFGMLIFTKGLVFLAIRGYIIGMDKQATPVLSKSAPSGDGSVEPKERGYNAATMVALQETSDIMSGKKKVKWNRFQPGETKAGAKKELEKILGS